MLGLSSHTHIQIQERKEECDLNNLSDSFNTIPWGKGKRKCVILMRRCRNNKCGIILMDEVVV